MENSTTGQFEHLFPFMQTLVAHAFQILSVLITLLGRFKGFFNWGHSSKKFYNTIEGAVLEANKNEIKM